MRKSAIVEKKHLLNCYDLSWNSTSFLSSLECTYILFIITEYTFILFNRKWMGLVDN